MAPKSGDLTVDMLDTEKVQQKIDAIKSQHGAINGLVHAVGIGDGTKDSLGAKSLFVVAKALDAGMTAPGSSVAGVVVLTRLGGSFESAGKASVTEGAHTQAGMVGVLKSLAKEWSGVKCKVVDFATSLSAEQVAKAALEEITAADSRIEIGRGKKTRKSRSRNSLRTTQR